MSPKLIEIISRCTLIRKVSNIDKHDSGRRWTWYFGKSLSMAASNWVRYLSSPLLPPKTGILKTFDSDELMFLSSCNTISKFTAVRMPFTRDPNNFT